MKTTARERRGYIYFIGAEDYDAIKIGFSIKPIRRIAQIQSGSAVDLKVLHLFPAKKKVESLLHALFAPSRVRGEWFGNVEDLRNFARHVEYCHSARVLRMMGLDAWPSDSEAQERFFDRFDALSVTEDAALRIAADIWPERAALAGHRRRKVPVIFGWPAAKAELPGVSPDPHPMSMEI